MMIMTISTTKKQKWPKIIFLGTIINEILASGRGMVRGKMSLFVAFFVHFDKSIRPHPGPLWVGGLSSQGLLKEPFIFFAALHYKVLSCITHVCSRAYEVC